MENNLQINDYFDYSQSNYYNLYNELTYNDWSKVYNCNINVSVKNLNSLVCNAISNSIPMSNPDL